jgi:hypothetical protein
LTGVPRWWPPLRVGLFASVRWAAQRSLQLIVALFAVLAATLGPVAGTTSIASAAAFAYDVPTISRVEVEVFDDAQASAARLSDVQDGSASPPAKLSGAVATFPGPLNATNFVQSAPSSRLLGESLEAAGTVRPGGSAAHHIVAGGRR